MSVEEIRSVIKKYFNHYDKNKDGFLDVVEFQEVVCRLLYDKKKPISFSCVRLLMKKFGKKSVKTKLSDSKKSETSGLNLKEFGDCYEYLKQMKKSFAHFGGGSSVEDKMNLKEYERAMNHYGLKIISSKTMELFFNFFASEEEKMEMDEYIESCLYMNKAVSYFKNLSPNKDGVVELDLNEMLNIFFEVIQMVGK